MNKSKIYLKHKQSGSVVASSVFEKGPVEFNYFINDDFTNCTFKTKVYHSLANAINSDDFDIFTDNVFTEEELKVIVTCVQLNACNLDVMEQIINKCVKMIMDRNYIDTDKILK